MVRALEAHHLAHRDELELGRIEVLAGRLHGLARAAGDDDFAYPALHGPFNGVGQQGLGVGRAGAVEVKAGDEQVFRHGYSPRSGPAPRIRQGPVRSVMVTAMVSRLEDTRLFRQ